MTHFAPPLPDNERERVRRVADLCYRDAVDDEVLDRIVALAVEVFDTPIALISILEEQQQWFRAKIGISATSTSRDVSFCGHTILVDDFFEIPDTHLDPRFRHNELVTGAPGIRYYAGVPLLTHDGLALGSLCVIDQKPRPPMSAAQLASLHHLSQLVVLRLHDLRAASFIDRPTRLMNRIRLEEDIHRHLSQREEPLLIAVDFLSPGFVNDIVKALGYSFSQHLVSEISRRVASLIGPECVLYRIGLTRFAFIKPRDECLSTLYEKFSTAFALPVEHDGIPIRAQIGMGALELDRHTIDDRDWVRLVVSAADYARDRGIGWARYQAELDIAQQRAFVLLSSLSYALEESEQLGLVFQPRIDFASGRCCAVEALLRWTHPTLGPIGPDEFVPLAEKTDLIRLLSVWVVEAAIQQTRQWRDAGYDFKVAINVSPCDLEGPAFTDRLIQALIRHGVEATTLEIEFTEGALIKNPAECRNQLTRLRALGVEISIDDFGTGYSNWTYLRELPATSVKLDRSLIKDIQNEERDRRLVITLIDLAQRLGYKVVAEGIENQTNFDAVKSWGCDEGQGYFIAMPMPAEELVTWIQNQAIVGKAIHCDPPGGH
ncbi:MULTISPECIES: putative bifunctional diguanylate cyclase/phosphodiesterase [Pseudomonas]|uniref:putative bifunctional diguanylate cyclase/phosphodiesterase n=1 Tax=Pseudomonas TaxID=286 RepID=UPI000675C959|nr:MULTISPECIES: sensor domain-containing phosphodiesterase [Pseudomonas]KNC16589.1 histidine kinase [Pseudomonas sp. RIT-PI-a]